MFPGFFVPVFRRLHSKARKSPFKRVYTWQGQTYHPVRKRVPGGRPGALNIAICYNRPPGAKMGRFTIFSQGISVFDTF